MLTVNLLPGLPPYGPLATAFPAEWGKSGREGTVVEFTTESGSWIANFQPGLEGIQMAKAHPNGRDAVVVARGDLWIVDPVLRSAHYVLPALDSAFEVHDPDGWVFTRQGLALARLGPSGIIWHTKRLSWDGFDQVRIENDRISGLAWSPVDAEWQPFEVELTSGRARGGSFSEEDSEGWEYLAEPGGGGAG